MYTDLKKYYESNDYNEEIHSLYRTPNIVNPLYRSIVHSPTLYLPIYQSQPLNTDS